MGNGFTFRRNWRHNLFSIQDSVFCELSVEFFAMVDFKERKSDHSYIWALEFLLGVVYRECILLECVWHMGLYTEDETCSPNFILFLQDCVQDFTAGMIDVKFWRTNANYEYSSQDSREGRIRLGIVSCTV